MVIPSQASNFIYRARQPQFFRVDIGASLRLKWIANYLKVVVHRGRCRDETAGTLPAKEQEGEGIVQTTNSKGAVKAVVVRITGRLQVRVLQGPLQF